MTTQALRSESPPGRLRAVALAVAAVLLILMGRYVVIAVFAPALQTRLDAGPHQLCRSADIHDHHPRHLHSMVLLARNASC